MNADLRTGGSRRAARFLLALVIIFAAEEHLTRTDYRQLPRVEEVPRWAAPADAKDNLLTYSATGQIAINGQPVPIGELRAVLEALYRHRRDRTLWLEGDGSVAYGRIAQVVDIARSAVVTPGMRAEQARGQ
jgi:biopolymer transport protein ExbD